MIFSPIFESLMVKIRSMPREEWDSKSGTRLFSLAMKHAPAEFTDMFFKGAMENGLFPKPTHCDADGNALYNLEEIGRHFGQTPDQVAETMDELMEFMPEFADDLYQGEVHKIQ